MREIKFRVHLPKPKGDGTIRYGVSIEGKDVSNIDDFFKETSDDGAVWMQYTGLKDKNGKEIYEGDIVSIGKGDLVEEVKWIKEKEWMRGECPFSGFVNHDAIYKSGVEVIGNIYENPELLESK